MSPAGTAPIVITPIGRVVSEHRSVGDSIDYRSECWIHVDPCFAEGLRGIEHFSHLWVIYHQHLSTEWMHTRGWASGSPLLMPADDDRAGQGVFSSRAPCRPARLGSCIVELRERNGTRLRVAGLDGVHDTPVLDLKVYVPAFDAFPDAVVPLRWARVLDREGDHLKLSRLMHWEGSQLDFALGLRAGLHALRLACVKPGDCRSAVEASLFFAQGWEAATGCSPLRGTLSLHEREPGSPWRAELRTEQQTLHLHINQHCPGTTAEIMAAPIAELLLEGGSAGNSSSPLQPSCT